MKRDYSRMVFKHVLAWLRDKDMPTSKIALQKALFFLQEKGVSLGYSFEPYSYGPFSRQIMEAASELERSGELTVRRTEYEPGPEFADTLSEKEKRSIDTYLDRFAELVEQGIARGEFKPVDSQLVTQMVMAWAFEVLRTSAMRKEPLDPGKAADQYTKILFEGINQ